MPKEQWFGRVYLRNDDIVITQDDERLYVRGRNTHNDGTKMVNLGRTPLGRDDMTPLGDAPLMLNGHVVNTINRPAESVTLERS